MNVKRATEVQRQTAAAIEEADAWRHGLEALAERIGPHFARTDARERAEMYLKGLLSPVERKNGWQMAEAIGDATPHGVQHLLGRAAWSADAVRDDLSAYVLEHMADPRAVLVIDETGFVKKGEKSVGVQRQYTGTAGKIENCQIGVFLAYATPTGRVLIDRELYLPEQWAGDAARRQEAAVPDEVEFATKPALARGMIARAFEAGARPEWVVGDRVYGDNRALRTWLQEREQAYVLGVTGKEYVWMGVEQRRITTLLKGIDQTGWERVSAGSGSKGERLYDWKSIALKNPVEEGFRRWVLVRRSIDDATMTAYVVFAPVATTLKAMAEGAGRRWAIEECFESAKGEVGLDEYEVRSWHGWYRHITLACLAHAYLSVTRAHAASAETKKGGYRQINALPPQNITQRRTRSSP